MKQKSKRLIATALLLLSSLLWAPTLSGAEGGAVFSARLQYLAGQKAFQSGDYQGAIAAFEEIFKRDENYQDVSHYMQYISAQEALDAGDLEAAFSGFQALSEAGFLDAAKRAEEVRALMALPREEPEAALEAPQASEAPAAEATPMPTTEPDEEPAEKPFENARVRIVTPAQIEVAWDAPAQLWVLVEVWRQDEKVLSKSVSSGKILISVAPQTQVAVTLTASEYSESFLLEMPEAKNYKENGYKREESYTAFVLDAETDFYKQTRKSIKTITRDELTRNLENGYVYGTHVNFGWKRTQEEKQLSDLIVVTRAPDGRVFVEETSPMTIPGNWTTAYIVIQINKSLQHFLDDDDFAYGKYEFSIYTQGEALAHSALTINP